ncbi:MAG: hypothetical protein K2M42_04995 [Oscillospiraceae bacterium]|nr:hypothetical protein [Oscillospiraceae bacterium]
MTSIMEDFYNCLSKTVVEDILNEDGEYSLRTSHQDDAVKRLTATLDDNIASRIDDLLCEQLAIGELRECAYFRAGFRLALELTR